MDPGQRQPCCRTGGVYVNADAAASRAGRAFSRAQAPCGSFDRQQVHAGDLRRACQQFLGPLQQQPGHLAFQVRVSSGRVVESVEDADRRWPGLERVPAARTEEHPAELQSLMRISYAVFCLKKKKKKNKLINHKKKSKYNKKETH